MYAGSKRGARIRRVEWCGSYADYLKSDYWALTRDRYRASDRPKCCLVCGEGRYELHHRTYARLGRERLTDLVPLCRTHHDDFHAYRKSDYAPARRYSDPLRHATGQWLALNGVI